MLTQQQQGRNSSAASSLGEHLPRGNAVKVVDSLSAGLTLLRNLLFTRVHYDVEKRFGVDSMLAPLSPDREERDTLHAKSEIEVYSIIVAAEQMERGGYVTADDEWILSWLLALRLGEQIPGPAKERIDLYRGKLPGGRRRAFATNLERAFPDAVRAPLVMYRLFPRAIRIVTAIAFGDHRRADEMRNQQIAILSSIADCHECHGRPLDNGETCATCGNPLWNYDWLCAD